MRAAGFVLTGGNSTRMGRDKALLPFGDSLLVEAISKTLIVAVGSAMLVGQPSRYRHLRLTCLPDSRPGLGPLAGLEAALQHTDAELNLVVSCDLPGLQEAWLRALLAHAEASGAPCVVTRDLDGRTHPLCGVYRTSCLPVIRRALNEGRLRLMNVVEELGADTWQAPAVLENVNTPQQWTRWQQAEEYRA